MWNRRKQNEYEEKTCYDFNDGYYAPISYYIINNYKILEWGDFYGQQIYKSRFKNGARVWCLVEYDATVDYNDEVKNLPKKYYDKYNIEHIK